MTFLYILLALLVFGLLVMIHELGHFLVARLFGVGIREFSIGMGPKIFSKKGKKKWATEEEIAALPEPVDADAVFPIEMDDNGEIVSQKKIEPEDYRTTYSLRALPIGGYVSMVGEDESTAFSASFEKKNVWKRIAIVLAGAFPLVWVLTRLLKKPLLTVGKWLGVNDTAAAGLVATLANSIATFGMVREMDDRGKVINVAFAVSAAFVFGDHLGFTAGFAPEMLPAMIAGKLAGGVSAVAVALLLTRKQK